MSEESAVTIKERPEEGSDETSKVIFWNSQLSYAQKAAKKHLDATKDAWKEFLGSFSEEPSLKNPTNQPETRFPMYWTSVKTIQPALYSRTPVLVAEKMFDTLDDNIARVGSLALERLGKYLIHCCSFDSVMSSLRDDFIHGAKATCRVIFESEIYSEEEKTYYVQQQFQDQQGQPVTVWINNKGDQLQDPSQLQQDEEGYFTIQTNETLDDESVCLIPTSIFDILHTPNARYWEEVDFLAFRLQLTKSDVENRFGPEKAELPIYSEIEKDGNKKDSVPLSPIHYATVWEIWDKREKKVYWKAEQLNESFLDVKDDPYELDGFFPCPPFILSNNGPDNLFPTPDYTQLRPLILQLHALARRLKNLIRATRRRGVYDASIPELSDLASDLDDAEFIGINNYQQQIVGKGNIESVVQYFPTDQINQTLEQMQAVFSAYQELFNQMYGIPDILRGVSDPQETAAAQQLKGKYISLRFSAVQREFQRIVRDSIELMCDLALSKMSDQRLFDIMGVRHMPPEDQQVFPQALILLKDCEERKIRINIETDSTITMNQDAEIEQRNYLGKTLFEGLSGLAAASQENPLFLPVAAQCLQYIVRGLRNGKEIEESLSKAIEAMNQPQPQQPPPPDYEMLKIQAQQQKTQMDAQIEMQKLQFGVQQLQADMQLKREEFALKAQSLAIEEQKIATESMAEGFKLALEKQTAAFEAMLAQSQQQLDAYRVSLDEREKLMEEKRLALEAVNQPSQSNQLKGEVLDNALDL